MRDVRKKQWKVCARVRCISKFSNFSPAPTQTETWQQTGGIRVGFRSAFIGMMVGGRAGSFRVQEWKCVRLNQTWVESWKGKETKSTEMRCDELLELTLFRVCETKKKKKHKKWLIWFWKRHKMKWQIRDGKCLLLSYEKN